RAARGRRARGRARVGGRAPASSDRDDRRAWRREDGRKRGRDEGRGRSRAGAAQRIATSSKSPRLPAPPATATRSRSTVIGAGNVALNVKLSTFGIVPNGKITNGCARSTKSAP